MASTAHMAYRAMVSPWFQNEYTRLQEYLIQKDAVTSIQGEVEVLAIEPAPVVIDGVELPQPLAPPDEFHDIVREEDASYREHSERNSRTGPWGSDQWYVYEYLDKLDAELLENDYLTGEQPVEMNGNVYRARHKSPVLQMFKSVVSRNFLRRLVRYLGGSCERRHAREKLNKKLKIALDMRAYVFRKISRQCLRGADLQPDFSPENKELVERTLGQYVAEHFQHPGQEEGYLQLATALCFMDSSGDHMVHGLQEQLIALRPGRFF